MIVIAKNNGPFRRNVGRAGLLKGKSYKVISWSYRSPMGTWQDNTHERDIPESAQFFVRIINEDGREADYWNDYFLSTNEMRELKLEQLI